MNPRNLFFAVAAVIVLSATFTLRSQGLTDGVKVTLPEPVTVGDVVLDPGEYEIRRASTTQDQVLRIFSNDKLRYQTNVLTIPALGKDTPEESKVVLHHIGDKYYFDKIWMEGKDYGYEFVLPEKVRALQRELAVTVPARYESQSTTTESTVSTSSVEKAPAPESSSQAISSAEQDREREAALARERQDAQDRERERQAALDRERQEQLDRDRVAAVQREPAPAAQSPADARQDRAPAGIQNSNRSQDNNQNQDQLPATASDWFTYVLGGSLLIAMAGFLRKPRTQEN